MNGNKLKFIIVFLLYVFILRFYFFTEIRHVLHFALGVAIVFIMIARYRELKASYRKWMAQIPLIVSYIIIYTLFVWYIQPIIVSWIS